MTFLRYSASIACLLVVALPAQSTDGNFYLGAGAGSASGNGIADAGRDPPQPGLPTQLSINGLSFEARETSWLGFVGYKLNPYLAVELSYQDMGEFATQRLANGSASLTIEAWALGATVRYPLVKAFEAQWDVGASRYQFDVDGAVAPSVLFPTFPPVARDAIPFATPGDRTGYYWGFGFGWRFNPALAAQLAYRQHERGVIEIETINLTLVWSLDR